MTAGTDSDTTAEDLEVQRRKRARGPLWLLAFACAVSGVVAIAAPTGYFWLTRHAEMRESAVAARLHAAFLTQVVVRSGPQWPRDIEGLIEADLAGGSLPERRSVLDAKGTPISHSGPPVAPPLLTSHAPLLGVDGPVGTVRVERSLRPVWQATGLVALATLALAAVIFAALYLLPLRALRRTIAAVRKEESEVRAREKAEADLRIVFENAIEGILMIDDQGRIVASNPAALRLLGGGTRRALEGEPVRQWFEPREGRFESQAVGPDGASIPLEVTVATAGAAGRGQRVAILRDITERRQHEHQLLRLANYDGLTGLPNRKMFRDQLQQAMQAVAAMGGGFALMFLDLDRFKHINDSLGHAFGDRLLQEVAQRLKTCLRDGDSPVPGDGEGVLEDVFRLGGDEFTILLRGAAEPEAAAVVARRIVAALAQPICIGPQTLQASTSIGIALYPAEGVDLDGLIKQADIAMYRAKAQGRNTYCFHGGEMPQPAPSRD